MFRLTLTEELAVALVGHLMVESQWFEVEPMPGNLFEITVKSENAKRVWAWVEQQVEGE